MPERFLLRISRRCMFPKATRDCHFRLSTCAMLKGSSQPSRRFDRQCVPDVMEVLICRRDQSGHCHGASEDVGGRAGIFRKDSP